MAASIYINISNKDKVIKKIALIIS